MSATPLPEEGAARLEGGATPSQVEPSSAERGETPRAITSGIKPRRYGSWSVAEHRIRSLRSYLQTVVFTSVGNPLVYLFALGVGLASLVPSGVGNVSYLVFVAPALLATAAVTVASEETTYPMMMGFKRNPIFLSVLTASFTGLAVGAVIASYTSRIEEDKGQMAMIMRFGITPMLLFSGTFFPLTQLPIYLQWARLDFAALARRRAGSSALLRIRGAKLAHGGARALPHSADRGRLDGDPAACHQEAEQVSAPAFAPTRPDTRPDTRPNTRPKTRPDTRKYGALVGSLYAGNARSVMSRGLLATKSTNFSWCSAGSLNRSSTCSRWVSGSALWSVACRPAGRNCRMRPTSPPPCSRCPR